MKIIKPKWLTTAVIAFALNPLVVTEALVSGHNDIVMMSLALISFYFLIKEHWYRALLFLLLSIGIKFVTVFLLPVYLLVYIQKARKQSVSWEKVILLCIIIMIPTVIGATIRTQFQPWYLLYIFPFAALVSYRKYIFVPILILTLSGLSQYVPFLYLGNWNPPVPFILNAIMVSGVFLSISSIFWYYRKEAGVK